MYKTSYKSTMKKETIFIIALLFLAVAIALSIASGSMTDENKDKKPLFIAAGVFWGSTIVAIFSMYVFGTEY